MARSDGFYDDWSPYVPVTQRQANAARELARLLKLPLEVQPVKITGRAIAKSFWGKAWCDHIESFGDDSNRLKRGRTYARNGSICHLEIGRGTVQAYVTGSSLYRVEVDIKALKKRKWNQLKRACTGQIGSLVELLQGRLSESVMATVTDQRRGLFPLPDEVKFGCDCPDYAIVCKHIAAVMYGIGARLDEQPELLFVLRCVDHEELISAGATAESIVKGRSRRNRRRTIAIEDLEYVFGVELEHGPEARAEARARRPTAKQTAKKTVKNRAKKTGKKTAATNAAARRAAFTLTGPAVTRLREWHGMSKVDFAGAVGVSAVTVAKWEKTPGALTLRTKSLEGLKRLYREA
ncbi:MAG: hypothetical protein Tsb0020_40360 [Haliangiales bacterium]